MNYYIPLSYNLDIRECNVSNETERNKEIIINNFKLYINKNNLVYKVSSSVKLEFLLDFLNVYEDTLIRKIYYFLIIKYLLKLNFKINYKYYFSSCFGDEWFDIVLRTREYHICYNNKIIITDIINYNICLIIVNNTNNKNFIGIIDKNCIIDCLYDIIQNNIYDSNRYDDIQILIIGGSIDNVNIIIYIYNILKDLKIAKFINKTYLFKRNPLNRLRFNTMNNSLNFVNDNNYYNCFGDDNSNHINISNFTSNLNRI